MLKDIRVGTAGWAIPRQCAQYFPDTGTGLERYATRFGAVEINSTFRQLHKANTLERWKVTVPDGFRCSVKFPKVVSHDLRLVGTHDYLVAFLATTRNLSEKLGPFLLQLPPSLAYDRRVARRFFQLLRKLTVQNVVCEPRHPTWFEHGANCLLLEFGIARVAAHPARVPAAASPGGVSTIAYFRLHGAPRMYYSLYDEEFLARTEAAVLANEADEIWCIFDNTASGAAMANALAMKSRLGSTAEYT